MSNKPNFHTMKLKEFQKEVEFTRPRIAVDVDIHVSDETAAVLKESFKDVVLARYTQRKTALHVRNFNVDRPNTFGFLIETEVPECFVKLDMMRPSQLVCTTFPDFCWLLSNGTTAATKLEVQTKIREEALLGDLTWVLPSKFADDLIEVMHCLNMEVLEGALQDAVLYGPILLPASHN
jgi:hypothetical protein